MWVTKLLISPVKKRIFCPKMTKFSPKLAFLSIAGSFGALLVGWLVVVTWAVSRKTPSYFINLSIKMLNYTNQKSCLIPRSFSRSSILLKVSHNSSECFSASANVLAPVVLADGHGHKMEVTQHLKETFFFMYRKRTHY